jgi:hypothetical protein
MYSSIHVYGLLQVSFLVPVAVLVGVSQALEYLPPSGGGGRAGSQGGSYGPPSNDGPFVSCSNNQLEHSS